MNQYKKIIGAGFSAVYPKSEKFNEIPNPKTIYRFKKGTFIVCDPKTCPYDTWETTLKKQETNKGELLSREIYK